MLAGVEHGVSRENLVRHAGKDLDLSLKIKRERIFAGPGKGYNVFGVIETIYFAPDDDDCAMPLEKAEKVGRRIYWPEGGPVIARSIPEQDLLIVSRLPLRKGLAVLPDVPDPRRPAANPYHVNQDGQSGLQPWEFPDEAPKQKQLLEEIALVKFGPFLVFHPISQLVVITTIGPARWGAVGSVRQPVSSLTSFDGSKMSLLVDPYSGEMFFKGGRYDMADLMEVKL